MATDEPEKCICDACVYLQEVRGIVVDEKRDDEGVIVSQTEREELIGMRCHEPGLGYAPLMFPTDPACKYWSAKPASSGASKDASGQPFWVLP